MSDTTRLLALLREHKRIGVHSLDLRRLGYSGNPSSRTKDLTSAGHQVYKLRENVGHRQGCRYWLEGFQPLEAVPVRPNFDADSDGESDDTRNGRGPSPSLTGAASPRGASGPPAVAVSAEDFDGRDRQVRGAGSAEPDEQRSAPAGRINRPLVSGENSTAEHATGPPSEEMSTVYDYRGAEPKEYEIPSREAGVPVQLGLGEAA